MTNKNNATASGSGSRVNKEQNTFGIAEIFKKHNPETRQLVSRMIVTGNPTKFVDIFDKLLEKAFDKWEITGRTSTADGEFHRATIRCCYSAILKATRPVLPKGEDPTFIVHQKKSKFIATDQKQNALNPKTNTECTTSSDLLTLIRITKQLSLVTKILTLEGTDDRQEVDIPQYLKDFFEAVNLACLMFTQPGYIQQKHVDIFDTIYRHSSCLSVPGKPNYFDSILISRDHLIAILAINTKFPIECASALVLE